MCLRPTLNILFPIIIVFTYKKCDKFKRNLKKSIHKFFQKANIKIVKLTMMSNAINNLSYKS